MVAFFSGAVAFLGQLRCSSRGQVSCFICTTIYPSFSLKMMGQAVI